MKTRNGKIARLPKEIPERLMNQLHNPEIREWVRTDWPSPQAELLRLKEIYHLKPDSKETPVHPSQFSRDALRRGAIIPVNQSES